MKSRQDNQYLSYILDDQGSFSMTAFRVLKKQEKNGLLSCYKVLYNGNIKLLYPTANLIPLSAATGFLEADAVFLCIRQILKIVVETKENGFLQQETIDTDISHMFLDQSKEKIFMIALPILGDFSQFDRQLWEENLRKSLISLISLSKDQSSGGLISLKRDLQNTRNSMNNLYYKLFEHKTADTEKLSMESEKSLLKKETLHLALREQKRKLCFDIDQSEFILGKNGAVVDGLVNLSPTISRLHCKIHHTPEGFFAEDLGSKNFTYLNEHRLEPGKLEKISDGDILRLAEFEFGASIILAHC